MLSVITHTPEETEAFAAQAAKQLSPGDLIACRGGMGAGKTAFARGLATGFGIKDRVSSTTFSLVHEYTQGPLPLYHFDMYRIDGFEELYSTGFFDYLEQDGVLLVEWSENIADALPENAIILEILSIDETTREIHLEGGPF